MEYIYATYLLEQAQHAGHAGRQRPAQPARRQREGLHRAVPQCCPPNLDHAPQRGYRGVSHRARRSSFSSPSAAWGVLDLSGRPGDPNFNVIVESLTDHGRALLHGTKIHPRDRDGDKRILTRSTGSRCPMPWPAFPSPARRGATSPRADRRGRPLSERDRWIAPSRARAASPRHRLCRARRDRRLPDRDQRDQPDLHPGAGRPVRPRHRRRPDGPAGGGGGCGLMSSHSPPYWPRL